MLTLGTCWPGTGAPDDRFSGAETGERVITAGVGCDPLPSWNDGPTKQAIMDFVARVTAEDSPDFVPVEERIATFDNDGTLWVEQPLYVQGIFVFDQVRALAPEHPEWQERQPYKAVLENDTAALASLSEEQIADMVLTVHAGTEQEEFIGAAREWLAEARHPRYNTSYTRLVYRPMLELMDYLRSNGFRVFIVSGGGVDFVRAFSEETYGVPRENVVGSSLEYEYGADGRLTRLAKLSKYDDAGGKPESIALHIGRRPIFVAGNSDGDLAMMRYAATGSRPYLNLLVHHEDARREYAYDRESHVGRLREALDEARALGWPVISMSQDWKRIFDDGTI
ncbi:nonspecific acid phosphatase [Methanocella arvoryzae MRE50]|uniref:phosphoserine phosphatase n=1 Tax=Methanocella arvoryzae (strain DSM 22066 / NBRC 105507 / MRE50) TaxID=351160 RepID=Q0W7R9_METAR|nr:nonspecific acid phosphatase [Methanocella arvoryzae MRE50]